MENKLFVLLLLQASFLFMACENNVIENESDVYGSGVYIVHEGLFGSNNGSISYYNPDDGTMLHNIFNKANGRPVGDVVQSFAVNGDTAGFIVVNNSAKVEIVNLSDFKTIAKPVTATYPRYFLPVTEEKGYLSNGSMQGFLLIINLHDFTVRDSIRVGWGPESLIAMNGRAYICNSGGWGVDSTLSVVDISADQVVRTIEVGYVPTDIEADADQNVWVYCKGYAMYSWEPPYDLITETDACLLKVNPVTGEILWQGVVGQAGDYAVVPSKFEISSDGLTLYYLRPDGVYMLFVRNPEPSDDPVIPGTGYYGIEADPQSGNLYVFEASLSGNGLMKIFDADLHQVASFTVGVMPNSAVSVP